MERRCSFATSAVRMCVSMAQSTSRRQAKRGTEEQEERCDMKPITTDEFRWFCGKLKDVFPNIEFVGGRQSGAAVEITAVIKKPLPVVPTTENKEKKNNHC
nr:MAG TPA: hypothetical protein [Caudoviricetes sp.]